MSGSLDSRGRYTHVHEESESEWVLGLTGFHVPSSDSSSAGLNADLRGLDTLGAKSWLFRRARSSGASDDSGYIGDDDDATNVVSPLNESSRAGKL